MIAREEIIKTDKAVRELPELRIAVFLICRYVPGCRCPRAGQRC